MASGFAAWTQAFGVALLAKHGEPEFAVFAGISAFACLVLMIAAIMNQVDGANKEEMRRYQRAKELEAELKIEEAKARQMASKAAEASARTEAERLAAAQNWSTQQLEELKKRGES